MTQAFRHVRARSKSGRALATARPMNRREFLALSLYIAIAAAPVARLALTPGPAPEPLCRDCGGRIRHGSRAFLLGHDELLENFCLACLVAMEENAGPSCFDSPFADELFA